MEKSLLRSQGSKSKQATDLLLRHYAEEVRLASGFTSKRLFEAYSTVPRERFLGPGPWLIMADGVEPLKIAKHERSWLYHNTTVVLNKAKHLNNGHPGWWANLLERADPRLGDNVLHIGCGTGYYTAILAELVGSKGTVHGLDVDATNVANAKRNLRPWPHVTVSRKNGLLIDSGSFDSIIVSAGINFVPPQWAKCMSTSGKMILPLACRTKQSDTATFGELLLVRRTHNAHTVEFSGPVAIYPCIGANSPKLNAALRKALRDRPRGKLSLRLDPHDKVRSCWYHEADACISTRPSK
jgi:protein-L-isoaspartate(D-aspartate) O-methyltransferase